MIFKNMKKTLATILITGTMMSVSFAAEEKSFLDQIKSIFVKESSVKIQIEIKSQVSAPQREKEDQPKAQLMMKSAVQATTSEQDENNNDEVATTTETFTCEQERKFSNKKNKTIKAIKDQTADKNKIAKSLIKLEATVDATTSLKIKDKRIQLDKEVKDVTDLEDQIVSIASSSVPVACDTAVSSKKVITDSVNKIKKLDAQVVDEADDVNNLIQKDIKELVKNLNK